MPSSTSRCPCNLDPCGALQKNSARRRGEPEPTLNAEHGDGGPRRAGSTSMTCRPIPPNYCAVGVSAHPHRRGLKNVDHPYLIHRLTYKRKNHDNMHVRGFNEEGTTTTPFDMVVLNGLDRFHLAMDVIDRVPGLGSKAAHVNQHFRNKLIEHRIYVDQHGEDMPEIQNWSWPYKAAAHAGD
jgi:XFP C-terminal domain